MTIAPRLFGAAVFCASGLVTLPGISVFLAPFAFITYHFHLSEAFPLQVAHPTAWLVLGPVEMVLGASVIFPLDRVARQLGVTACSRVALCFAEAVVL